jgi:hypothetical protein
MPDLNDAPDLDATVPVAGPTPSAGSAPRLTVNLPLPEDLAKLLPEGTYTVQSFLGQGGMGAVYRGTQVRLQRQVAIKIMCRDQGRDHGFEERFRREALALAQLNHPNIVNVIDYGEAGPDYLYIVMEFVDGTDLVGVIRSGQMTQETALKLLPQICDALQFAHDNGIVHRDIKPANILLTRDGRIKMADFGLAKRFDVNSSFQTQTGAGMGTPDYAAPEQFDPNGNVDHRADIYALGVMIYQMVTGTLPRGAWKPPSEKADVDAHWDKIVSHALQTDPSDRYASVSEIKNDLGGITTVSSGPRLSPDGTQSFQTAGMPAAKGSTTALTQAGGRPASKVLPLAAQSVAQHKKSSRSLALMLFVAALIVLAVVGYFVWDKFKPAAAPAASVADVWESSAPQPKVWVDATPELRELVLRDGVGKTEGEWITTTKAAGYGLANLQSFKDVAVRVTLSGPVLMYVRRSPGLREDPNIQFLQCYNLEIDSDGYANLFAWDVKRLQQTGFPKQRCKLGGGFDLHDEYELIVAAQGDQISMWVNGQLLLSQKDSALKDGGIGMNWFTAPSRPDVPLARIKKVEYADLGGTPPAVASQSAVSRTWQAPQPTVTVGTEWTNLIPHIQPQRDVIRGEWSVDEKGLHAKRAEWAICNIPVQDPGTDYDLRYQVTRGAGSHLAMFFAFRKGSTGGYVPIDYIGAGAEFADGQRLATLEDLTHLDMRDAATIKAKRKEWLPRGKACTVLLQVREKEVIVSVDGQEAFRWPAEWSKLQQKGGAGGSMFLDVTGGPIFGVGIFNCEATFHSIEMRKVPAAPVGDPGSIPHLLTSPDYEWTAPVNLGPLVNSPNVDLGPMVSPDGLHLVFSSLREGDAELFECRRPSADEPWSKPSRVFQASEEGNQDQPWMSPDELRLIYHATTGPEHHGKLTEGDIYFRQRPEKDQPWQPPVNLGSKINHPGHDVAVRLSNDERTLLFTSTRPGGQGIWDVWRATRTSREALFGQAENMGPDLNSADADFHATFAADDRTLLFLRGSPDLNVCRLFMATSDAKGQYQTTALDFPIIGKLHNPWLSADGRTLWFAWNGPGGVGDMDLWEIRRVPKAKRESAAAGGSSTSPGAATKEAPFENSLGMKFVPVPITGGPTDGKRVLFSVWETRVQDYEAFVSENKRAWTKPAFAQAPDHPAVNMSWDDAKAFCIWLTERERKAGKLGESERYRLATDHEWSCAVGIGFQEDATKSPVEKDRALAGLYPWGATWPPPTNVGNYAGEEMIPAKIPGRHPHASPCIGYRDAYVETAPAGSFPANERGLHDLAGSVWEWCEEWYDDSKSEHVLRGGAYIAGDQDKLLTSARNPYRPTAALSIYFGFRCVLVPGEEK